MTSVLPTHRVTNQPPPLEDFNAALDDLPLREGLGSYADWGDDRLEGFGARIGSAEVLQWSDWVNRNPPVLRSFDRYGHRLDEVEFHPAYHQLMTLGLEAGVGSLAWTETRPGAHVVRAGLLYLLAQVEAGVTCPMTMTHAVVPALQAEPSVASFWLPRILSSQYDARFIPAGKKTGITFGMAMTEKQGGSDVRANSTVAKAVGSGGPGQAYELTGHKWFCSAPMCDAFLTLAYSEGGLSCFLVPRFLPDGSRNRFLLQRLKDKLGNRSNASSEIEYDGTHAVLMGPEGRGVSTIIQMVHLTRVDCALGSAGLMRMALRQALHHCEHRQAFGKRLLEQPLMRNVLADLALESEAATTLALRVAHATDAAARDPLEAVLARVATPVAKYWLCKRTPGLVGESLECLGGAGYVEESIMPRLYREAPLNSLWEGSGNVQCLDVLRALHRQPESREVFFTELDKGRGDSPTYDRFVDALAAEISHNDDMEPRARRIVERMAMALQASLLRQHAPVSTADLFVVSRLGGDWGQAYGTLPDGGDLTSILRRARG